MISIALAVILSVAAAVIGLRAAAGDVTTESANAARTAWDPNEPGLGADSLLSSDFGQTFLTKLKGSIYGQPLSVGGTLIVTTEDDQVYGIDPGDGSIKWHRDMGPAWPASAIACGDLAPTIGVTSAPVYDPASNSVYLTTKVNDGADLQHPNWYMHAINPVDGAERDGGWPVKIEGKPSNDPSTPFNPMVEHQRAGLLLLDGVVYAGFGSHCDKGQWRGYIAGVNTNKASMASLWTTESGASTKGAGIWQSGGGLVSDGAGRIFFTTGNGVIPPKGPGNRPPGTLGESVVRLQVKAGQPAAVADFFSPADAPRLETNDTDLGAGGPIALPGSFGTRGHRHLLVQLGKDGRVFLLDRDRLGGRMQARRGRDAVLGVVGPFQGQWGHPAAWSSDNGGYVYFVGNGGPLRALKSGVTGKGMPALSLAGTSADTFPYTSGSPVVTSSGGKSGTGVVWVVWVNGSSGGQAQLRAYRAIPNAKGQLALLYSVPIGTASKFSVPATDGNHVFVGTRDGYIMGFGKPANSALTGSSVDFGNVAVGTTTQKTITLTATKTVQVNTVSTQAPFTASPPTLPAKLKAGDQLKVPVSYSPSAPGPAIEILSVHTDSGTFGFSLNGFGTAPGLSASPSAVTFTDQPVGTTATVNVQVTNTGSTTEKVTAVTGAAAPYSATGMPEVNRTLLPGASVVMDVTYAPKASSNADKSSIVIRTNWTEGKNSGTRVLTIPIIGNAVSGSGKLVVTPANLDFGSLGTGTPRTLSFDITNAGNRAVTITKAKAPISDFTSSTPVAEGTVIGAGQVIHQAVTFKPSAVGLASDLYEFTGDAGQGAMTVPLKGVGTGAVPAPAATNWSANPSATVSAGGSVQLTPAAQNKVGSAFYTKPVRTEGLHATFSATMNGGTGGDGMSFSMLDPAKHGPTSVGGAGTGLGFSGLHGIAVTFVTTQNAQANSNNFVGITVGTGAAAINYLATAAVPTSLRTGSHSVDIQVTGGHIKVSVDGTPLLDTAVPAGSLPANAIVGFTGATDTLTDAHTAGNVSISTVPAAGAPLTANPVSVDFGDIQVGSTGSASVTLDNKGPQPETVTAVNSTGAPFSASLPAIGTTVPPGSSATVPVSFKPTTDGTSTGSLTVTTGGGSVVVPITGNGINVLPSILTSSWSYAGLTTLSGSTATLTKDGQKGGAGSLVNSIAVSPIGVHARFTAEIGGSHAIGADGMTFALLDASVAKPGALGFHANGLGLAGLPGVFAALDTYDNTGIKSHNFAAIGTSTSGTTTLNFLKTTTAIPALRTGTHQIDVTVTAGSHMLLKIDGTQVLDVAVTLPPKVLVAFTAGVGGISDTHAVLNPTISYTSR